MLKWLTKADKGADLLSRWFLVYSLMTGAYTWLARHVSFLSDLNWAELIFVGIICALITMLAVSMTLALIRYFRPISAAGTDFASLPTLDHELGQRVANLETEIEGAQDGEGSLRTAMQAFMKVPMQLATEFNERQTVEAGKLREELEGIKTKQTAIIDDYQRMLALEARFEEAKTEIHSQLSRLWGHRALDQDGYEARFDKVFCALAAVFHRETLQALAREIEERAALLSKPTTEKASYDAEAWEEWEELEGEWRSCMARWTEIAEWYQPGVFAAVNYTPEKHYRGNWSVEDSQFPNSTAAYAYRTFAIRLRNWRDLRENVGKKVQAVAFEGGASAEPVLGQKLLDALKVDTHEKG